jgi:mono/diheme cytochrome c family protein
MLERVRLPPAVLAAVLCAAPVVTQAASDPQDFAQRERGRSLTVVADCAACHTVPGGPAFAGGRPIETPFGTLIAPNITPDPDTGIGAWTDDEFVNALRRGTGRNGEHLYPAMPYNYLTKLTRQDALDIRAYLNTVTPVLRDVVANQLPFPFNIRISMLAWNALFFREGEYRPDAGNSAEWNRGAFLVEGPAHCGACHTPKNLLGGDKSSETLQGSQLQGWFAPNITNDARRGLGGWSADDIAAYLRTGHKSAAAASGPMGEEVALSSSHMSDADLRAIAVYLKSRPGQGGERATPVDAGDPAMKAGSAIYTDLCSACHTKDGSGVTTLIPPLKGAPTVQSVDPISLVRVVLRGARSVATDEEPTAAGMPSFAWQLDDDEVASVTTYIRNAWGNAAPAVSADSVGQARTALAGRSD